MARVLLAIALGIHVLGVVLSAAGELRRRPAASRAGASALAGAWGLELATIVAMGLTASAIPLRSGAQYLLVLGWFILSLHLVLWFRSGVRAAALVLPPIAAVMVLAAFVVPDRHEVATDLERRGWFVFHTSVATAGMAALAVAFAMAVLFLVKERLLKSKRPLRVLEMLPSLETLDRLGFHALLYGFPLLTLGIATGMVFNEELYDRVWTWGLKEVFPVLAWAVFAALLYARFARGVRGRRSAILAIAGFALGLMTLFGMVR